MKQETKCIHAGSEPDPTTGAIMTPIYDKNKFQKRLLLVLHNYYFQITLAKKINETWQLHNREMDRR